MVVLVAAVARKRCPSGVTTYSSVPIAFCTMRAGNSAFGAESSGVRPSFTSTDTILKSADR